MQIKDCCKFEAKSKIKAGEACTDGEYTFFTSSQKPNKIDKYIFDGEYLIMGTGGSASLHYYNGKFATSTDCFVLKPTSQVYGKFLYYILKSKIDILERGFKGAGLKHTNKDYVKSIEVGKFPIYDRQVEIVEKLDLISEAIECEEDRIQLYDELVKSKFVEMFGNPEDNNFAWEKRLLDDLCRVTSSKRVYQEELTIAGIPFLKVSDIVNKIDKNKCEPESYIPVQKYEELEKEGYVPKVGDILITARGTLGKCYIIDDDDKFYFQDGMVTWLTDISKDITPRYLVSLFALDGIKNQILKMKAGAAVNYLSIGMTKKLEIMLPPRELQLKFEQWFKKMKKQYLL